MSNRKLTHGIYDVLLDEALQEVLAQSPELRSVLGKLDAEEQPAPYLLTLQSGRPV